jgi:hypothetical protein
MPRKDHRDVTVMRELAKEYAEICRQPVEDERRELWRRLNSLQTVRPLFNLRFGDWNYWCREEFGPRLRCEDPFFRDHELRLRLRLFHATLGDDAVFEPWIAQAASRIFPKGSPWGVEARRIPSPEPGGACRFDPPIKELADIRKLVKPRHVIDEEKTVRDVDRLRDAVGDILTVCVDRSPGVPMDLSNDLAQLRGLEQIMYDMIDNPDWLHELLSFLAQGVRDVHEEAEKAGDWRMINSYNQSMPYGGGLSDPSADGAPVPRSRLWCHMSAQELTLVSPAMHEEFMLRYQIPIAGKFGLCAYGCCEDLTAKIDMLRQMPNLRSIAVAPRANLGRCAGQIGGDYVISWRPNPAEMICCGAGEDHVHSVIRDGLKATRDCHVAIVLKDIETVDAHPERLRDWARIVREEIDRESRA